MKVDTQVKLNNGTIEIVTKKQHQFSDLQKKILNILALQGYYEVKFNDEESFLDNEEYKAIQTFIHLGLAKEDFDAWHYTIEVEKLEEVGCFFLQILKEGV